MILSVLSTLGKQVYDNSGSRPYCRPKQHNSLCPTLGASQTARCLPTTSTRNQKTISPKVVSRPTPKSNNGIPNGAWIDTAVTIKLRFALLNVKYFSDFSLPLPACTTYCLHALRIDFMWHRLFLDMLGNGCLGALSLFNRIAMFLLLYTKRTQFFTGF